MATCLLRKNPEVKKQLDEYTDILGSESAAYYVLSENNGYGLEFAPNGLPSKLFSDLLSHFNGDKILAIKAKAKIFTDLFKTEFGDWLDPSLKLKEGDIVFGHPAIGKTYSVEHGKHAGKFIDWDVEYNAKRDKWIEEHSGTKKGTPEYKKARNEYLIYPEKHPDYIKFLTDEWNRVKAKAKNENKILIASPHNLLKMFTDDFNYIIDLEFSDFINRNINRGGDEVNSRLWKEGIDNTINNVSGIKRFVLKEGEYFEDILNKLQYEDKDVDSNGEPLIEHLNVVPNSNKKVYHQTKENKTYIPRDAITDRTFKHIADTLARLFPEITVLWHQNLPEGEYGRIDTTDLEAITIMLSDDYQADTLPHEYAHRYIEMFRETPIVQKAIQKYGSEEVLVQAIGELVVEQKGDAYNFWKRLWQYVKAIINGQPVMKLALLMQLTNSFLQRKDLAKKSNMFQLIARLGQVYFQKAPERIKDINKVKAVLQEIASKINFDVDSHTYSYGDKILTAVSTFKQKLLYSVYDDSDISENLKQYNDDSRIIGTTIHAVLESMFNNSYRRDAFTKPIFNLTTGKLQLAALSIKALQLLENIYKNISNEYELVATEAILADFDKGVAGTTDLLLKNKKTGKFAIFDYKTKCIVLDGKTENKDGKKLWGFSYVNRSKNGAKTASNAYDFLLGVYERILKKYGIDILERGIIPIVYHYDSKTNTVQLAFFSKKMGTYEVDPKLGVFNVTKLSSVQYDIDTYVFGESDEKYDQNYVKTRIEVTRDIVNKIISSLENKAAIDRRQGRRTQARRIEQQLDQMGNVSEVQAMMTYLTTAIDLLSRVYGQIEKKYKQEAKKDGEVVNWDLLYLRNYKDLALSFNVVGDISGYIQRFRSFLTAEQYETLHDSIGEILTLQESILDTYKKVGENLYMDAISQYVSNIEYNYRNKYRAEYVEQHRNATQEEINKYVDKKILENRDEIEEKTLEWLRSQRNVASDIFECSAIAASIGTVFQSRDPFVQASVKIFDEKMQDADHKHKVLTRRLLDLVNLYEKKYKGGNWSDHRKLYDDMIEIVDGQAYLVNAIPNSFRLAKTKMLTELNNDHTLTWKLRQEAIEKWYEENAPISNKQALLHDFEKTVLEILSDVDDKYKKQIIKNLYKEDKEKKSWKYYKDKKIITIEQYDDINEAYKDLLDQYRVINTVKYPNPKYEKLINLPKDDIKRKLWEMFVEIQDIGDNGVASRLLLNYRLPGIRKEFVERVSEKGIIGAKDGIVQAAKESSVLVEDDAMTGQAFTDMNGNIVKLVPLFYNQRLNLDMQSFDLPTIYLRWLHSALEHQAKLLIEDYLLMTQEILKNRLVETSNVSILSKIIGKEKKALTKSENTYKQFAAWLDLVFYGNQIRTDTEIGNISVDKLAKTMMKYYSMRVMGTNYISMINNLTVAELNLFIEAFGSKWIDHKSMKKASVLFGKHLVSGSMLADLGKRAPEDFINQLADWFNVFSTGDPNYRANGVQRLFTTDAAYWTTNIGERVTLTRFLLAALCKLKAKDKNGRELGSMIDFLSFNENGELIVDDRVTNFDEKRILEFSIGVRSVLMSMHGNYADRYAVAIQQYIWGKMLLMFRKWIYTSFKRRFGKAYYDNIRGENIEGYHTTLLRVTKEMFYNPAVDKLKVAIGKKIDDTKIKTLKYNLLSEEEKRNLKRSIAELSIIVAAYALSNIFRGLAEDDDDNSIIYMNISYLLYRVYTDFSFYFNPWSFTTIIQDPFTMMSAVDNLGRMFDRLFSPTDVYTTGKNAGENKLLYSFGQMIPIYRQLSRFENIQYEFDFLAKKN